MIGGCPGVYNATKRLRSISTKMPLNYDDLLLTAAFGADDEKASRTHSAWMMLMNPIPVLSTGESGPRQRTRSLELLLQVQPF
jgi:hypothetical protein